MAEDEYRDEKGMFKEGNPGGPGRPPGMQNKYTIIKGLICDSLIKRKDELDTAKLNDLVKFIASTAPKETKLEVNQPIIVSWQGENESSTAFTSGDTL